MFWLVFKLSRGSRCPAWVFISSLDHFRCPVVLCILQITMASTAALETSVTAHNDTEKDARARGRLLTPEPTPGVEDGRVAADLARKAAAKHNVETPTSPAKPATGTDATEVKLDDVQQEIERVLRCADESYAEILAVSQSSTEEEILAAWRRLGCMLHPHYCHHNDSKAAYRSK